MTDHRSPPPEPEVCLCRPYPSSQKGGTLIAEDVRDLAAHERRLGDPDAYRPACCPRCGAALHVHDLRARVLRGEAYGATEVLRFRCADRARCGAAWQVLPAFLARHLWRSWAVVETASETPQRSAVPGRTRRRWGTRLTSAARRLIALLTTATARLAGAIVAVVGLDGTRRDLVRQYAAVAQPPAGTCLAELATWIHRLERGVRLM
jgi:hypothetical protein